MKEMKYALKNYIISLSDEYHRCINNDKVLTENRSDNYYYYYTRAELLIDIINDLNNIIKVGEKNERKN